MVAMCGTADPSGFPLPIYFVPSQLVGIPPHKPTAQCVYHSDSLAAVVTQFSRSRETHHYALRYCFPNRTTTVSFREQSEWN